MSSPQPTTNGTLDVLIVDPKPGDYAQLAATLVEEPFVFRYLSTADEALRVLPGSGMALWLINTRLPDMSGFELYELLRARHDGAPIYLIGDEYTVQEELRSRACGAALYMCKPPDAAWLADWRTQRIAQPGTWTVTFDTQTPLQTW